MKHVSDCLPAELLLRLERKAGERAKAFDPELPAGTNRTGGESPEREGGRRSNVIWLEEWRHTARSRSAGAASAMRRNRAMSCS